MAQTEPEHIFKTGDPVRIRYGVSEIEGTVLLASENGYSLMLSYEAILGGMVGLMPVLFYESGNFRDLINQQIVYITPREK